VCLLLKLRRVLFYTSILKWKKYPENVIESQWQSQIKVSQHLPLSI